MYALIFEWVCELISALAFSLMFCDDVSVYLGTYRFTSMDTFSLLFVFGIGIARVVFALATMMFDMFL